ncbi:MAG: RbsD/FucU domain-containing protein [Sphaerochaeta sp.]|uniref:RbsD/FucU family protein n=1 Tax=Sphaerochaeta sp. TaxID=1972642 RepID=UPI001DCB606D|nr:RbsD/FucU domain-containing protein [uncultured Sphaerochaeta sp.]MDD3057524.1 RbsD/FucU domain-containing protein [Sphaerochaeta sp.]MDD3928232.1 RbsD/FucU domain-containing protein [Sphaerochaeta sp.]NCC12151.1 fucose isomerase [Spirochaetia bacterium]NCC88918.1 fucose isomerase [Spirochaetia bacterium]
MLKMLSPILGPDLLKILMEMGHGDELVIADGNFPAASMNERVVRLDGNGAEAVLRAVLSVYPLDSYAPNAFLMEKVKGDAVETPIWASFEQIAKEGDPNFKGFGNLERYAFYERSKKAYAIIATSESALYANVILKKGVVV